MVARRQQYRGDGRRIEVFSNIRHDLSVYKGDWGSQGFWAMLVYRFGRWRYGFRMTVVRKPLSLLYKLLYKMVQILTGIELPCEVPVGRNFRIDHFGGIIISGFARFGDNCIIRNGVTIGLKNIEENELTSVYRMTGPGVFNKVIDENNVNAISYRYICSQGNFTNEFFQYIDKPEGKWTKSQKVIDIVKK